MAIDFAFSNKVYIKVMYTVYYINMDVVVKGVNWVMKKHDFEEKG